MRILVDGVHGARRERIAAVAVERGHEAAALPDPSFATAGWDLAIVDLTPGDEGGAAPDWATALAGQADRCRALRAAIGDRRGEILVLGPAPAPGTHEALLDAGADDYLVTSTGAALDEAELRRRLAAVERRIARAAPERPVGGSSAGAATTPEERSEAARREAEAARAAAERRYRALFEQMPAVIYLAAADEHGTPLFISPQVEAITGLPPAVWQARPELWAERMHPDDLARVIAAHLRANGSGEVFHEEYRLLHRDGHYVWIRDEARQVAAEDGAPIWQGIWVDITARKEAEQALRASERRYRDLVEHSEGLILTHDLEGVVRSVNPAVARGLGYRTEDLLGTDLRRYLTPVARATFGAYLERIRREPVASGQLDVVTRGGDERFWSYRNVRSEEPGQPPYVIAHAHDITDRYQAEAALRASEARVRRLLASEQRKTRELDLLSQVRQALAEELDLPALIRTVVEGVRDTFGYPLVSLYLIEDGALRLQHQVGYPRSIEWIPLDRGVIGRVARTGEPVLLADARHDPAFIQAFDAVVAEVSVPLMLGGEVVGVLNVESTVVGGLGEDDLRLMLALADNVSVALGRIRLYAALRASEERFRTAFDAAPIGMVLLDPDLRPLRINRAFGRMLGFADDATQPAIAAAAAHPADRPAMRQALGQLVAGTLPGVEREVRYRHRDGREIWGQVSASLVRDDAGSPVYIILQIQDVSERKALAEKLRHLALHDPLTGLANRTQFLERLADALGTPPPANGFAPDAPRPGEPPAPGGRAAPSRPLVTDPAAPAVAVLFLDLDGFKLVNDRFGHEAGDQLLAVVGRRLATAVRPGDVVARFGGDEFTVVLDRIDSLDAARATAERLVAALQEPVALDDGQLVALDASGGLALGEPGRTAPDELLRAADVALYRAKGAGRGGIAVFDPRHDLVHGRG